MKTPRDLSGAALISSLQVFGYSRVRQTGSHVQLVTTQNGEHHLSIPLHSPIKVGTLSQIIGLVAEHFQISKKEALDKLTSR